MLYISKKSEVGSAMDAFDNALSSIGEHHHRELLCFAVLVYGLTMTRYSIAIAPAQHLIRHRPNLMIFNDFPRHTETRSLQRSPKQNTTILAHRLPEWFNALGTGSHGSGLICHEMFAASP